MTPTDEQVTRAITAFDETWRKRPDITVKNFHEARRDSMRAALQTVTETPPHRTEDMTEGLAEKLKALSKAVAALQGEELYLDNNLPWRIMLTSGGSHKAVAEQHPETTVGDGEWTDGNAICEIVNTAIKLKGDLDTIISALSGDGMGWRDISTAPKDGTPILGYWGLNPTDDPSAYAVTRWYGHFWGSVDDEDDDYADPTHWMPLPASPALTNDKEG